MYFSISNIIYQNIQKNVVLGWNISILKEKKEIYVLQITKVLLCRSNFLCCTCGRSGCGVVSWKVGGITVLIPYLYHPWVTSISRYKILLQKVKPSLSMKILSPKMTLLTNFLVILLGIYLKYGSEDKCSSLYKCSILLGFILSKNLRGLWFYLLINGS
jgi:hypothetical protein